MASNLIPTATNASEDRSLTREEGWELLESMRGILKESYAKLGGSEEYHRKERESWDEDSDGE